MMNPKYDRLSIAQDLALLKSGSISYENTPIYSNGTLLSGRMYCR